MANAERSNKGLIGGAKFCIMNRIILYTSVRGVLHIYENSIAVNNLVILYWFLSLQLMVKYEVIQAP